MLMVKMVKMMMVRMMMVWMVMVSVDEKGEYVNDGENKDDDYASMNKFN